MTTNYLREGREYFRSAQSASLMVKPLLIHELLRQTERYYPNLLLNEMFDEEIIFKQP